MNYISPPFQLPQKIWSIYFSASKKFKYRKIDRHSLSGVTLSFLGHPDRLQKNISNKIKTCLTDNESIVFAVFTCGGASRGRSRDPVQRSLASGTCFPLKRAAREKEREIISESHKYHQRRLLFSSARAAIALVTRLI
jgi:hypothetical protein